MVEWLNQNGEKKTPEEIERWANEVEASSLYNHPEKEKRDYFSEETKKLGLDPARPQRSSGWKSTIESPTHSKRRRGLCKVDRLLRKTMESLAEGAKQRGQSRIYVPRS